MVVLSILSFKVLCLEFVLLVLTLSPNVPYTVFCFYFEVWVTEELKTEGGEWE